MKTILFESKEEMNNNTKEIHEAYIVGFKIAPNKVKIAKNKTEPFFDEMALKDWEEYISNKK